MKFAKRTSFAIVTAALVLTLGVNSARADKPTTIPVWFDGETVLVIPAVSQNVVGVTNHAIVNQVANPLYVFGPQNHVLGTAIPGVPGYNPWWAVVVVTVLDDRDVTTDPFTSEEEILEAYANGEVDLLETDFVLLCQVVRR
ncbi:MAG TPA: hypothetical protein VGR35_12760 [Tepidisphaeraceae bacterium]|nr:hypothetical protein [Tepidisphaeraceae bacterium]